MRTKRSNFIAPLAIPFWLIFLLGGMAVFMQSTNSAGVAAAAPGLWPAASRIERETDRVTLVVLAHPHCPCTRATINELSKLMTRLDRKLTAYVVFTRPDGVEADWEKSDTWMSAANIPGVYVISDDNGLETQLFGARTSGQAMLYDSHGKLLFSGGITIGRGAEGDSTGASAIVSLVSGETPPVRETSVFGCPLFANDPYCHIKKEPSNAKTKR